MLCEICGKKRATTKINTEGITFNVCEDCLKFGREIQTQNRTSEVKRELPQLSKEDLLSNYTEILKKARQQKGWKIKEVANKLMEKENVIHRVESGKMLPDDSLIKKLEKLFSIKLTGIVSGGQNLHSNLPKVTLGDLAEVKVVSRSKR